jgi:hypothetical protein
MDILLQFEGRINVILFHHRIGKALHDFKGLVNATINNLVNLPL